jgi:peptidoglycan/LPS O-acetylase OafA/YrhL
MLGKKTAIGILDAQDRIFGLDLMRAIAILIVMYMHGMLILPESIHWLYNLPLPAMDGVSVFFVLSGFLIGGILLRILEGPSFGFKEVGNFWIRRWFRTLPNYMLVLTLVWVCSLLLKLPTDAFDWTYYVFSQNLFTMNPKFFPEAWSLSVEEWFYLCLPLLILGSSFLFRQRKHAVLLVAVTILIVPLGLRMWQYSLAPTDPNLPETLRQIVLYRVDSLMYGVIMAYLWRYQKAACLQYKKLGLALALALVFLMTLNMRVGWNGIYYRAVWLSSLEPLAGFLALPFLADWQTMKWNFIGTPIRFISTASYSMYLLNLTIVQHMILPIFTGEISWAHQPSLGLGLLRFVLYWIFTLGLSWILFRYFERPMRDLRDKFSATERPAGAGPKQ